LDELVGGAREVDAAVEKSKIGCEVDGVGAGAWEEDGRVE